MIILQKHFAVHIQRELPTFSCWSQYLYVQYPSSQFRILILKWSQCCYFWGIYCTTSSIFCSNSEKKCVRNDWIQCWIEACGLHRNDCFFFSKYENKINWMFNCLNLFEVIDSGYRTPGNIRLMSTFTLSIGLDILHLGNGFGYFLFSKTSTL